MKKKWTKENKTLTSKENIEEVRELKDERKGNEKRKARSALAGMSVGWSVVP